MARLWITLQRNAAIIAGAGAGIVWAGTAFAGIVTLQNTVAEHERRLIKVENATESLPVIAQSLTEINKRLDYVVSRLP